MTESQAEIQVTHSELQPEAPAAPAAKVKKEKSEDDNLKKELSSLKKRVTFLEKVLGL